jgi:hypothetical protein
MGYVIRVVEVDPTAFASVRQRVGWGAVATAIPSLIDRVYAHLRGSAIGKLGQNVCVYHDPSSRDVELEAGVQVAQPFEDRQGVCCSRTPAGRAVWTVHVGRYEDLPGAHDAVALWCQAENIIRHGVQWEVFGHWDDTPASRRTDVYRLLGPTSGEI